MPDIPRESVVGQDTTAYPTGSLGSRIVRFQFEYSPPSTVDAPGESKNLDMRKESKLIPTSISTYRLQGIVARLFGLRTREVRLVLETDEVDPVDQADGEVGFMGEGDAAQGVGPPDGSGKWMRREEELVGSTRPVSDWLPTDFAGKGAEARVRVSCRATRGMTME